MKTEGIFWILYVIIVVALFFLFQETAHAEKVAIYLYCGERTLIENIGRIEQEQSHDAANEAAEAALRTGDCLAASSELPLYIVFTGHTYKRDGVLFKVVGLSPDKRGEPVVWELLISHDDSA